MWTWLLTLNYLGHLHTGFVYINILCQFSLFFIQKSVATYHFLQHCVTGNEIKGEKAHCGNYLMTGIAGSKSEI